MSVFDAPAAARTGTGRAPVRSVTIHGDGSGRGVTRVPMNPRARDSDEASDATSDDDDDLDDDDLETSGSDADEEEGLDAQASTSALVALTGAGEGAQCVVRGSDGVARGVWRCALFAEDERVESDADVAEAFGRLVAAKDKPWVVVLARGGHFAASVFDVRGFDGSGDAPKASAVAHTTSSRYVVRAKAGGRQVTKDAGGKNIKSAGSSIRRQGELALEQDMRKTLAEDWKDAVKDASRIFISVSKVDAKTLFNAKNPILDRKDARIRRVPFMTQKPTFNETRRVAGRLAAVNLNVVEERAPPAPAAVDEELTRLVDTKFIIAAKPKAIAEEQTAPPEEAEPEAPEPELHAAARAGDADRVLALLIDEGADPTVVYRGKVAYVASKDKDTRDAFRRAMARAPDAWDWISQAQVPSALTEELEAKHAAKEAEYEAARRAKEKERKKAQKERKKKQSAAAALLAKTPPVEERDEGGSKSAALLEKAGKDAKDRREQMSDEWKRKQRRNVRASAHSAGHTFVTRALSAVAQTGRDVVRLVRNESDVMIKGAFVGLALAVIAQSRADLEKKKRRASKKY